MKRIFIESKYKGTIPLNDTAKSLPNSICIVSTVQYSNFLDSLKKDLEALGKSVTIGTTRQAFPGQVLGCDVTIKNLKSDSILYLGDGKFHPLKLSFEHDIPVYILNPNGNIKKIPQTDIDSYQKKKKGALLKFHTYDSIGVLFTTKPGQNKPVSLIRQLKTKYPAKHFFTFIADEINFQSLENFPFIKAWVNTACPRIEEDFRCVNITDIL